MKPTLLVVLLLGGLIVPGFALDRLDQWAPAIWTQTLATPKSSVSMILTKEGSGKFKESIAQTTYTSNPDGTYTRDYSGPDEVSHSLFLQNGRLQKCVADNSKDQKVYSVMLSSDQHNASFLTEMKGKKPSSITRIMGAEHIIMPEYVNLIRQAWQHGIRGGFAFKGLAPDGSMEIDMETRLIETNAPWKASDKYEIPSAFMSAFPDSQKYVVADFNLSGMFSFLYKFHNYWIFKITPEGLEFAGSFGGDPKKAVFTFMSE